MINLLRVKKNGLHNAYGGKRDEFHFITIAEESQIPKVITEQLALGDYVLVSYKGKTYHCEKNENNDGYTRKVIDYHPLQKHLTSPQF